MNQRLLSLDVFRGMTVMMMILVNNPGDWGHIYAPLEHAEWNGCTPTDLVFPFFLFIVGVAIPFAFQHKKPDYQTISKIFQRSLKLFGLGLFLSLFPRFDFSVVRIMGVLQRISLVFLICSILFLITSKRTQIFLMIAILLGYWFIMTQIPVPDAGAANLEPESNLGAWLDRIVLGTAHLYKAVRVWDPEGLLSSLPAIGTGLSGVLTGQWLQRKGINTDKKVLWMLGFGFLGIMIGFIWNMIGFPINKSLWTSSFVCWTSGWALSFLAVLYWVIDIKGLKIWTRPFVVYGVNAITVFFLSGLIPRVMNMIKVKMPDGEETGIKTWLYESWIVPFFTEPKNASLAGAVTFVIIWLIILWIMYQKKIIIKV